MTSRPIGSRARPGRVRMLAALTLVGLLASGGAAAVRAQQEPSPAASRVERREAQRAERTRQKEAKRRAAAERAAARRAAAAERALEKEGRARREHAAERAAPRSPSEAQLEDAREQAALDPAQPYWLHRIGELQRDAHAAAAAESAFRAALARDADYPPSLAALSALYYRIGRHEQALRLLEPAGARATARPGGLHPALAAALALHYEALDRHDEARAALAALPDAGRSPARGALVYLHLRGDHPDSAAGPAEAAVEHDPRNAVHQNNYGIVRLRAGDPAAAERAFLRAIDLDPALAGPYYNLAILARYYRCDDAAAARWLDAYRRHGKDDPDSLARALARGDGAGPSSQGR